MTRQQFIKAVQDILLVFDASAAVPEDVPNIMAAVQILLQQEKKTTVGVRP